MKEALFNPFGLMATPETKKKRHHQMTISGGDINIGAVVSLGGSLAVAGLVAVFAMKTRLGRWRRDGVRKKQENVEELNGRNQWVAELDSLDPLHKLKPQYLAAIAEEPKSPAVDGSDLPLNVKPNPPLVEPQSSVEKLIIWKPLFREANTEGEPSLAPIREGEDDEDRDECEDEEDESVGEGEVASEVTVDSSSATERK